MFARQLLHQVKQKSLRCQFMSSRRENAELELGVREALKGIVEPVTGSNLLSIGALQGILVEKEKQSVRLELDLLVPGHPFLSSIKAECEKILLGTDKAEELGLSFLKTVEFVDLAANKRTRNSSVNSALSSTLHGVQHAIAVSSCKGGVGKSTVAANLALSLAKKGLRVGLLDADVYGPSVPLLVPAEDTTVKRSPDNPKHVLPLLAKNCPNLKLFSFGHVNRSAGVAGAGGKSAAILRGPIASRVITQMLASTDWGQLDYLVVDLPPGTGDIQITLTQSLAFTGAVVVTTPHPLSVLDAAKGVHMFEELKVPVLSVVENMAYFTCDAGKRYYPFGKGGREQLLQGLAGAQQGDTKGEEDAVVVELSAAYRTLQDCPYHSLPLTSEISCGDTDGGKATAPVVLRAPESEVTRTYESIADGVVSEILKLTLGAQMLPAVSYVPGRGIMLRYFSAESAEEFCVPAWELRTRDPQTGERSTSLLEQSPQELQRTFSDCTPEKFDVKGNYGLSIVWSDGHYMDIFPFDVLKKVAQQVHASA